MRQCIISIATTLCTSVLTVYQLLFFFFFFFLMQRDRFCSTLKHCIYEFSDSVMAKKQVGRRDKEGAEVVE